MKVLKKGKTEKPWVGHTVTCQRCEAKLKLERGDRVKLIPDQREGDYYEVKCPECHCQITMDASLFR
jgi:ribosomal protein S27E